MKCADCVMDDVASNQLVSVVMTRMEESSCLQILMFEMDKLAVSLPKIPLVERDSVVFWL